jgi:hypothetical protein
MEQAGLSFALMRLVSVQVARKRTMRLEEPVPPLPQVAAHRLP